MRAHGRPRQQCACPPGVATRSAIAGRAGCARGAHLEQVVGVLLHTARRTGGAPAGQAEQVHHRARVLGARHEEAGGQQVGQPLSGLRGRRSGASLQRVHKGIRGHTGTHRHGPSAPGWQFSARDGQAEGAGGVRLPYTASLRLRRAPCAFWVLPQQRFPRRACSSASGRGRRLGPPLPQPNGAQVEAEGGLGRVGRAPHANCCHLLRPLQAQEVQAGVQEELPSRQVWCASRTPRSAEHSSRRRCAPQCSAVWSPAVACLTAALARTCRAVTRRSVRTLTPVRRRQAVHRGEPRLQDSLSL